MAIFGCSGIVVSLSKSTENSIVASEQMRLLTVSNILYKLFKAVTLWVFWFKEPVLKKEFIDLEAVGLLEDEPDLQEVSKTRDVLQIMSGGVQVIMQVVNPMVQLSNQAPRNVLKRVASRTKSSSLPLEEEEDDVDGETVIRVVSARLARLCRENDTDAQIPEPSEEISSFYSVQKQDFEMEFYVKRVWKYVDTCPGVFFNALLYLDRVQASNPSLKINSFNVHRLFMTAVVLAVKFLDDQVYSNKHYATVGGISSAQELNQLELTMLHLLDFRLHIDFDGHMKYKRAMTT